MAARSQIRAINLQALADIRTFVRDSKAILQETNRYALLELGYRLVKYSPVGDPRLWERNRGRSVAYWPPGYTPGHFINNWQVGIDFAPLGEIPGEDASGRQSIERMTKLGRWTIGHTYVFANNCPYAYKLETGLHSFQVPPQGMIGRVQMEWKSIVRQALDDVRSMGKFKGVSLPGD